MNCVKVLQNNYNKSIINLLLKAKYSRKSAKSIDSYTLINSDRVDTNTGDNDFERINSNWELFGNHGFRFYLPGTIGPGWLDVSKTAVPNDVQTIVKTNNNMIDDNKYSSRRKNNVHTPTLYCEVQKCPLLLRKGIIELFPGNIEVASQHLTIVTITQKFYPRSMRQGCDNETEKLAKFFVIAAYNLCMKLKMFGYWANFVNPFSGLPYMNPQKNATLYKTDERFRCLGFKVSNQSTCQVITHDNKQTEFIGSLFTNAPSNADFLKSLIEEIPNDND
ncbi:hypothetical protein HCN44_001077 [Aphidius gifuensis]|uniref:Uncharacterized protein n=1 Tax=Aphidius gifuensis TaxID=684658 RepID=A0A835CMK4_APHGI|nr:methylmalonic aciduria and homocystinuria type D homolog, mitochondrial-like [Aphidius gifuensis]KAF7988504.1 hypothetical protein HCN44_001077 [Aphidius gifuensis]